MVFTVKPDEETTKALVEKFTTLIKDNATLESVDEWGKRRLAYEINKEPDGYYVLANFTSEPEFLLELDRIFRITDGVLRTMITRRNEHADSPKADAADKQPASE